MVYCMENEALESEAAQAMVQRVHNAVRLNTSSSVIDCVPIEKENECLSITERQHARDKSESNLPKAVTKNLGTNLSGVMPVYVGCEQTKDVSSEKGTCKSTRDDVECESNQLFRMQTWCAEITSKLASLQQKASFSSEMQHFLIEKVNLTKEIQVCEEILRILSRLEEWDKRKSEMFQIDVDCEFIGFLDEAEEVMCRAPSMPLARTCLKNISERKQHFYQHAQSSLFQPLDASTRKFLRITFTTEILTELSNHAKVFYDKLNYVPLSTLIYIPQLLGFEQIQSESIKNDISSVEALTHFLPQFDLLLKEFYKLNAEWERQCGGLEVLNFVCNRYNKVSIYVGSSDSRETRTLNELVEVYTSTRLKLLKPFCTSLIEQSACAPRSEVKGEVNYVFIILMAILLSEYCQLAGTIEVGSHAAKWFMKAHFNELMQSLICNEAQIVGSRWRTLTDFDSLCLITEDLRKMRDGLMLYPVGIRCVAQSLFQYVRQLMANVQEKLFDSALQEVDNTHDKTAPNELTIAMFPAIFEYYSCLLSSLLPSAHYNVFSHIALEATRNSLLSLQDHVQAHIRIQEIRSNHEDYEIIRCVSIALRYLSQMKIRIFDLLDTCSTTRAQERQTDFYWLFDEQQEFVDKKQEIHVLFQETTSVFEVQSEVCLRIHVQSAVSDVLKSLSQNESTKEVTSLIFTRTSDVFQSCRNVIRQNLNDFPETYSSLLSYLYVHLSQRVETDSEEYVMIHRMPHYHSAVSSALASTVMSFKSE